MLYFNKILKNQILKHSIQVTRYELGYDTKAKSQLGLFTFNSRALFNTRDMIQKK